MTTTAPIRRTDGLLGTLNHAWELDGARPVPASWQDQPALAGFDTPDQALAGGLVRSVHPADELLAAAYELARKFTTNRSPVAVAFARQMVYRNSAARHPRDAHLVDSLAMFYTSIGDGKEGVAAFLEKRDPEFTGKASEMPEPYPF